MLRYVNIIKRLAGSRPSAKKDPVTGLKNLGWKDSNLRDGWTKTSCLTTWRHPTMSTLPILSEQNILSIIKSVETDFFPLHKQLQHRPR